jgi:hypothetical protein
MKGIVMKKPSEYSVGYCSGPQSVSVSQKVARFNMGALGAILAGLCIFATGYVRAEEADLNVSGFGNNPLLVIAKLIRKVEFPPCLVLRIMSGGRMIFVLPPKIIVNRLMDFVIVQQTT